ncbi:MAG: hypothetical protein ACXWOV_02875 [Isosphaeraceae bacterium]
MNKLTDFDIETIKEAAHKLQARDRWHADRLLHIAALVAMEVDRAK